MQKNQMRQGIIDGALLGLLVILIQPFSPTKGLIPELSAFLTALPLRIASMISAGSSNALLQGLVLVAYFIVIGGLIGIAFERKALWGWLLIIALSIHHYVIYDQFGAQMGEVIETLLKRIN